jgi:hypothetical protein
MPEDNVSQSENSGKNAPESDRIDFSGDEAFRQILREIAGYLKDRASIGADALDIFINPEARRDVPSSIFLSDTLIQDSMEAIKRLATSEVLYRLGIANDRYLDFVTNMLVTCMVKLIDVRDFVRTQKANGIDLDADERVIRLVLVADLMKHAKNVAAISDKLPSHIREKIVDHYAKLVSAADEAEDIRACVADLLNFDIDPQEEE